MSIHGLTPWKPDEPESAYVSCVLFSGYDEENSHEDLVYVAVNAHWTAAEMTLPDLPEGYCWRIAVNTGDPKRQTFAEKRDAAGREEPASGRTVSDRVCGDEAIRRKT